VTSIANDMLDLIIHKSLQDALKMKRQLQFKKSQTDT